jgi:hypothetical protein
MVDFSSWQKRQLEIYRARLRRVEGGEVWGRDRPGPYTAEEKAAEIARIKALIAESEKNIA